MKAGHDLLQKVLTAFLAQGIAGMTMVSLARSVGVTRRTLYNYFSSREDAFRQGFWHFNIQLIEASWARGRELRSQGAAALDVIAAIIDSRFGNMWRVLQPSPHAAEIKGAVFHLCADQLIQLAAMFQADLVLLIEDMVAARQLRLKPGFSTVQLVQMLTDAARGVNQVYPTEHLDKLYTKYRDTCEAVLYGYAEDREKG